MTEKEARDFVNKVSTKSLLVELFFKQTCQLRDVAMKRIVPLLLSMVGETNQESAISTCYLRIASWLETVSVLKQPIHLQAASAAARTCFEVLLDIKYLDSDPLLSEKFIAFVFVERYRAAEATIKISIDQGLSPSDYQAEMDFVNDPASRLSFDAIRIKHWGTNKHGAPITPSSWSGKSTYDLAKTLGATAELEYRVMYPRLSWYVHGGNVGYKGINPDGLFHGFGIAHAKIHGYATEATEIVCKRFQFYEGAPDLREALDDVKQGSKKAFIAHMIQANQSSTES